MASSYCTYKDTTLMIYTRAFWLPLSDTTRQLTTQPTIKAVIAAILYIITTFVHEEAWKVLILLSLILVDAFTGMWMAIKLHQFSSSRFRHTIIKVLFYCVIIGAFHALEEISSLFRLLDLDTVALVYLSATEVISIVENSGKILGISIPGWMLDKIKTFIKSGPAQK